MIDPAAQPLWMRTGYTFFPFAARQSGQWWVLRMNFGFPEHDMYTVFVDGQAAADVTGAEDHSAALVRSVAALSDSSRQRAYLEPDTAALVIRKVARYVNYGSERDDPCNCCFRDDDGMTRA